jgi:hypothetical protein
MNADLPLTRGRLMSAVTLIAEAQATLVELRKDHPILVADLPERLAVLQGLTDRHEDSLWRTESGVDPDA